MDSDVQVEYEVWQDGMMVASSSDLPDARHYVMMYEQDGPCEIIVATTTRAPLSAAADTHCTIVRSADPTTPDYMAVGTVNPKPMERCEESRPEDSQGG